MNLLFIQGGTRVKKTINGNYYTDGNLNNKIWERYKKYCDKLIIVLRKDNKIYLEDFAKENFNSLSLDNRIEICEVEDLMRPKKRFLSVRWRNKVKIEIEKAILKSDKVIIRSAHNFYTLTAIDICKKYNKPYLIEVAGFAFDGYWGHGDLYGKLVAIPYELKAMNAMKNAKYVLYVTNKALQKRYPSNGKSIGCSDVELKDLDKNDLINKINRFKNANEEKKIIIGTIGWVNIKLKGQQDVIKAIYKLKKKGITKFEYQLVGLGEHEYLDKLIKKYKLEECIKILGPKPHDEVFKWLENIDIYIQPSYQEGLCRALLEAMSKACPIIVSDAGGNPELANSKYVFKKKCVNRIVKILENITYKDLISESKRSFEIAKEYERKTLDTKRDKYYKMFINNEEEI